MAEKRKRARNAGLCITCCKRAPLSERAVCVLCVRSAAERAARRRQATKQRRASEEAIAGNERAADRAFQRQLYADAAEWYQKALDIPQITLADRLRITEKARNAYLLTENPTAAKPLTDWLAKIYLASGADREKGIRSLMDLALQMRMELKTEAAIATLNEASRLAKTANLASARAAVDLQRAKYLGALDRAEEAYAVVAAIPKPRPNDYDFPRSAYHREKFRLSAFFGNERAAASNFTLALRAAESTTDPDGLVQIWGDYAFALWQLGDLDGAAICHRKVIEIARKHRILWRVSRSFAILAKMQMAMGRDSQAREALLQAEMYGTQDPWFKLLFAVAGIPLGLKTGDNELISKCYRQTLLEKAFDDGNPTNIGWLTAAFTQLYASRFQHGRAKALVHRALKHMRNFAWNWDFVIAIARHGSKQDMAIGRKLCAERLKLPRNDVALATLALFDAIVAQRRHSFGEASDHAKEAITRFGSLGWHGYSELARDIVSRPLLHAELTPRRQRVAELVLNGQTNRSIAQELQIGERAVEKHVAAILRRFDLHSRKELMSQ